MPRPPASLLRGPSLHAPQSEAATVAELLHAAAQEVPDAPFLHRMERASVAEVWSFAETQERVEGCATRLWSQGVRPGDVVATASRDPLELAVWALAVWRLGAVVFPCPTPPRPTAAVTWAEVLRPATQLARVWGLVGPADLVPVAAEVWGCRRLDPALLRPTVASELPWPDPTDTALLQFLSGSLRRPSSPVLSHESLVANVHALGQAMGLTPQDRMLSWLPLHADMGLVGMLLTALAWRLPLLLMRTETFLVRPTTWLTAMSEHRATVSAAPDFAYQLTVDRTRAGHADGLD